MEKVKLLFLIHDLKHGGAEKVLVNLINNMHHDRYDITVMTLFDVGVNKQFLNSGITYKYVFRKEFRGNKHFFKVLSPEKLYRKYIKETYDVVIAYLEGSCTRILSGCPGTDTVKIAWRHISESKKEYLQAYRSEQDVKAVYEKYDFVAGVSESVVQNFLNLSGLPAEKAGVVYNTNETEKIKTLALEEIRNKQFDFDGRKIVGVAKVRPRKGFMRLAEVHKRLQEEGYQYKIFVLGEGEEREKIEEYLKKNNLEDTYCFLGYDTNPYKYVSRCDLFICPSFEEGFSTAATEALIVGTPVLTTLCSGMEEMLGKHNEYGMIVENSTEGIYVGMKKFLDEPELFRYYHEQALIRREMFSTGRTVQSVEDMIDSLLEKKRGKK